MVHDCWALTTKQNIFYNYDACCSCSCSFVHSSEGIKVLKPTWTWMCNLFASCPSSESAFFKSVSKNCWILLISFNGIKVQKAFWKNTIFVSTHVSSIPVQYLSHFFSHVKTSSTFKDTVRSTRKFDPSFSNGGRKKWFSIFSYFLVKLC